jgi:hypothetical protein
VNAGLGAEEILQHCGSNANDIHYVSEILNAGLQGPLFMANFSFVPSMYISSMWNSGYLIT